MYEVVAYGKGEINAINHPEIIKWKIFKWHNEQWVEAKGNDKTGKKVTYNFSQKSYAKKILVEAFVHSPELRTPPGLIVKPCLGPRKIIYIYILNTDGSSISKTPKYGQSILLRVGTENMLGEALKLSLWDRDTLTDKGHDPKENQLLWSGVSKKVNSKGIAEQTVMLSPSMMQLANKSMFDGSEHEYYLLVESEKMKTISTTTQVSNEIQLSPVASRAPVKKPEPEVEVSLMDQATLSIKNAVGFVQTKVEGISNAVVEMFSPDEKIPSCEQKYCIKKGDKSELIREINIRLAGFGGNVPTDEFTDRTEKMIKQFQRDYMKVEETGKVCGNVLKAIDEFCNKYVINFNEIKCKCGKCTGYGNENNPEEYQTTSIQEKFRKYEYPGLHRSLVCAYRASIFYLEKDKHLGYKTKCIESGYRCHSHPIYISTKTTNHCGKALDIHYNLLSTGKRTKEISDIEKIRLEIFNKYLGAKWDWKKGQEDIFNLESTAKNATTWVHVDVREFSQEYLLKKYFVKNNSDLNGKSIIAIANSLGFVKTCMCDKGYRPLAAPNNTSTERVDPKTLKASDKLIQFIKDWEKLEKKAYNDSKGYCTIGYGHLIKREKCEDITIPVEFKNGITEDEATKLFKIDLEEFEKAVQRDVIVKLYQREFDALVDILFNCGAYFLSTNRAPKLYKNLLDEKYEDAAKEFLDIENEKRRKQNYEIFINENYDSTH